MSPLARRPAPSFTSGLQRPDVKVNEDYKNWREVFVRVNNLPLQYCNTAQLYSLFSHFGQIARIIIEFRGSSYVGGKAVVIFSTTPTEPFWASSGSFTVSLRDGRRSIPLEFEEPIEATCGLVASPIVKDFTFQRILSIPVAFLTFGLMRGPIELLAMHQVTSTPEHPVLAQVDLTEGRHKLDIRFSLYRERTKTTKRYRIQAALGLIDNVLMYSDEERACLVISLRDPPRYFQQTDDIQDTHKPYHKTTWSEWPKMWERQTDIDYHMEIRAYEPISLVRTDAIIDTGRWLTYRLDFSAGDPRLEAFCAALDHHGVRIERADDVSLLRRAETEAWNYLDPHNASHPTDLHQMRDDLIHLDFDVRYQLEVCISQHRLNEYNMKLEFFHKLSSMDENGALGLLENVADSKKMYYDPMRIFEAIELRARPRKRIAPRGCVLMHAVTVTPTTLRVTTPTVEVSNRVIRDHSHVEDRFLRVKFEDEDYNGRLWSSSVHDNQEEVYRRIERALRYGISIAGRHYDFLAHGNSQFREHGGYFFARTVDKSADQIRSTLGHFNAINIVAKYAARIGQCFSTTHSISRLPRNMNQLRIPDVYGYKNRKKYCFTDGVGKVSPFVAQMIADEFRLNGSAGEYPSVFQFRMGGHKGVLAVDPALKGITVALRPSQSKFPTDTEGLEIIRVSSFAQAYLNQQIILILSALGVPDRVFVEKMATELANIDRAMADPGTALALLRSNVDFNQVSLAMSEMILDGFMEAKEPMFMSILQLWRAWRIKLLKEKAHLAVSEGAFVLGCTDETQTLRMNGEDGLAEIFIQVKDPSGKAYVPRQGLCLLARNPSLHAGDVRLVRAVACAELIHLKDVVVFPQVGERDLANMCSGGDLDGDDYLVVWDKSLFPPQSGWNYPAMDFTSPTPKMSIGAVTKDQLIANFINYIKNDRLGKIATLHRAWADHLSRDGGVKHPHCVRLAQLHSIAVDFPKSGVPAEMDENLANVPQWPHWMERKFAKNTYHSKAVLGQLYDTVVRQEFQPQYENAFDSRILDAYQLNPDLLVTARKLKDDYDVDIRRIMAQQGVKTEFEIWTSFVMDHNREKRDYQFAEEMGRLINTIKHRHRDTAMAIVGVNKTAGQLSEEDWQKLGPFVAAMYTVTSDQIKSSKTEEGKFDDDTGDFRPLISYPWIFATELGLIARSGKMRPQRSTPISLGTALPRRMKTMKKSAFSVPEYTPIPEAVSSQPPFWSESSLVVDYSSPVAFRPVESGVAVTLQHEEEETARLAAEAFSEPASSTMNRADHVETPVAVKDSAGFTTDVGFQSTLAFRTSPVIDIKWHQAEGQVMGTGAGDATDRPPVSSKSSKLPSLPSSSSSESSVFKMKVDSEIAVQGTRGKTDEKTDDGDVKVQQIAAQQDASSMAVAAHTQAEEKKPLDRLEELLNF